MGLAHGHKNAAAYGAAVAGGQIEVIGTHGDSWHHLLRFTDQGGSFHWGTELTVLDQIALFHGEIELTRGPNASAPHRFAIQPLVDRTNQVFRFVGPGGDIGVAHATGSREAVTLAPSTARAGMACAHLSSPVAEEAFQDAILDQHGALGFHALVVHGN